MKRLATVALVATSALGPATTSAAAGGFLAPRNLEPAQTTIQTLGGDFNASGTALFAVERAAGGGRGEIAVDLRRPGRGFVRQLLPSGGSAKINKDASVAADLSRNGRGVVAWTQTDDTIHYALRGRRGGFGAARTATLPPASTAHLQSLSVGIDDAGNVTFAWNDYFSNGFGNSSSSMATAQRRASDGAFVSGQLIDQQSGFESATEPAVRVTASGHAVLVYALTQPGPPTGKFAFRDPAIGSFGPRTSEANLNTELRGAIDEAGDAAFAYSQSNVVKLVRRPARGAVGAPVTIDATSGFHAALVGLAAHAVPSVVWTRSASGTTEKLLTCRVAAGGCAPGTTRTLDRWADSVFPLSLAEAPSGAAVLAWERQGNAGPTIMAAARTAGHGFGPRRTLGAPSSSNGFAGIDAAGDGVVSWLKDDAAGPRFRFSGFDPNRPRITKLSVPKNAHAGRPVHFSAGAFDVWGPVHFRWRFGDGTSAGGPRVQHSYPGPGKRTITLTATDAAGNARSVSRTVKIG